MISKAPTWPHTLGSAEAEEVDEGGVGLAMDPSLGVAWGVSGAPAVVPVGGGDELALEDVSVAYWLGVTGREVSI